MQVPVEGECEKVEGFVQEGGSLVFYFESEVEGVEESKEIECLGEGPEKQK